MSSFTAGNVGVSTLLANLGLPLASAQTPSASQPLDVKNIPIQATFAGLLASLAPSPPVTSTTSEPSVPPAGFTGWSERISQGLREGTLRLVRGSDSQAPASIESDYSFLAAFQPVSVEANQDPVEWVGYGEQPPAGSEHILVPLVPAPAPVPAPVNLALPLVVQSLSLTGATPEPNSIPGVLEPDEGGVVKLTSEHGTNFQPPIEIWTVQVSSSPSHAGQAPITETADPPLTDVPALTPEPQPQPGSILRIVIPQTVLEVFGTRSEADPSATFEKSVDRTPVAFEQAISNKGFNPSLNAATVAVNSQPATPAVIGAETPPELANSADIAPEAPVLFPPTVSVKKESGLKSPSLFDTQPSVEKTPTEEQASVSRTPDAVEEATSEAQKESISHGPKPELTDKQPVRIQATLVTFPQQSTRESAAPDSDRGAASIVIRSTDASPNVDSPATQGTSLEGETTVVEQVVRQVRTHGKPGESEIVVRLNPDSLGEVRIRIVRTDTSLVAEVVAENRSTQDLLARHAEPIRLALLESGVKTDQVVVKTGSIEHPVNRTSTGSETSDRAADPWRETEQQSSSRRGRRDSQQHDSPEENLAWRRWDLYA